MTVAGRVRNRIARMALCIALLAPAAGFAHKASDGYLQLADAVPASAAATPAGGTRMLLSLAVKDLDAVLPTLDADGDRRVTWGETRLALPAIIDWVAGGAAFRCGGAAVVAGWRFDGLEQRIDGAYVRLSATANCAGLPLGIGYTLMKNVDPTHRLIVSGRLDGQPVAAVLSPQGRGEAVLRQGTSAAGAAPSTADALPASHSAAQSGPATLAQFFAEGLHHIVTGYDHLAFLLALMLPIGLYRRAPVAPGTGAQAAADVGSARRTPRAPAASGIVALVTTVTGFTLGHSLTLVLATFGVISSPSWVEPAIAITIAVSALLNLYPLRWVRGDVLALVFGMIHGLAFSSVMTEAGISGGLLVWGLAGFNLGVEAGQLIGVALWCGLYLALARWKHYRLVVVQGGSVALLAIALYWAVERIAG